MLQSEEVSESKLVGVDGEFQVVEVERERRCLTQNCEKLLSLFLVDAVLVTEREESEAPSDLSFREVNRELIE